MLSYLPKVLLSLSAKKIVDQFVSCVAQEASAVVCKLTPGLQLLQTLCAFKASKPFSSTRCGEHFEQTVRPQRRQWCFHDMDEKCVGHNEHWLDELSIIQPTFFKSPESRVCMYTLLKTVALLSLSSNVFSRTSNIWGPVTQIPSVHFKNSFSSWSCGRVATACIWCRWLAIIQLFGLSYGCTSVLEWRSWVNPHLA